MKKVGVYILKGAKRYVGSTNDLERRLEEHKRGKCYSTKRIGNWNLHKFFPCDTLKEARVLEKKIKGHIERWV